MIGAARKYGRFATRRSNNVEVYLLFGDSNQGGPAWESDLTDPTTFNSLYAGAQNCDIYYRDDQTTAVTGGIEQFDNRDPIGNQRPGYSRRTAPYAMGNEASFAYTLGNAGGLPKVIFKWGIGGTTLITDWYANFTTQFVLVQAYYTHIRQILHDSGYNEVIFKGINVKLGTNDAKIANWNQANFRARIQLFCSFIKILFIGDAPIQWVQVNTNTSGGTGFSSTEVNQCRQEITDCAAGGAYVIPEFTIINHDALGLQADLVHYSADAFVTMGITEANALL